MSEQLTESLQEAILAVLAFDDKQGALVAAQVLPEHFTEVYRDVASAVLNYRKKYQKAPGSAHLEHLLSAPQFDASKGALRRVVANLSATSDSINSEYIVSRTQDFVRAQKLGAALLAANERYVQGGDDVADEVEGIMFDALRHRSTTLSAGTFLTDVGKSSAFQEREDQFYSLGIRELDEQRIGMYPKRMLLYVAPKNTGKSWFCVHAGRQALLQKAKVVHITCEMPEMEVLDRYYQSFFGIASDPGTFTKVKLDFDELERMTGFKVQKAKPRLDFTDPTITKHLQKRVEKWGSRFRRLVIKEFPSGQLTVQALRGYLDYLEQVENFIPNVMLVDYPDLFKIGLTDFRLGLGRVFVDLRGIAGERNLSLVCPTQGGRDTIGAKKVSSKGVSEDISKVFTADTVLSFSQTEAEGRLGLGRISVEHARNARKGSVTLLTQSYSTGQYVLQSAALNNSYWDKMEMLGENVTPTEEEDYD